MWWSLNNLLKSGILLASLSLVPNYIVWLLSRNNTKLNRPGNLFIWTLKRGCVVAVTICLPARLLELSTDRKSGELGILLTVDVDSVDRYLLFRVLTAVKHITLGVFPWMVCFCTQNFNVKRLSYKIVLVQMSLSVLVTFCISIGLVSTVPGSHGELATATLYSVVCTFLPLSLILWNCFSRWRTQLSAPSTRTPIYSSRCISYLWMLLLVTYLPSDVLRLTQLFILKIKPFPEDIVLSDKINVLLVSENLTYIADYLKYLFVGFFPLVLLKSKQFRALLAVEASRKREYFIKSIGQIFKAKADKRSSVASVSSNGVQRSFSVVINEHRLCLHSQGHGEICVLRRVSAPDMPCPLTDNVDFPRFPPDTKTTENNHPECRSLKRSKTLAEASLASAISTPSLDLTTLKIDLHQLHTTFDEFCDSCVHEKKCNLRHKGKKPAKAKSGMLLSDQGDTACCAVCNKDSKDQKSKHSSRRDLYKVQGVLMVNTTKMVEDDAVRRETTTSIGQIELVQNIGDVE